MDNEQLEEIAQLLEKRANAWYQDMEAHEYDTHPNDENWDIYALGFGNGFAAAAKIVRQYMIENSQ